MKAAVKSKLTTEQLDAVSGGTALEACQDSQFLNSLNGSTDRWGKTKLRWGNHDKEIRDAWYKVGIIAIIRTEGGFINEEHHNEYYFLNGDPITQEQAREHAMEITGHFMETKDWQW